MLVLQQELAGTSLLYVHARDLRGGEGDPKPFARVWAVGWRAGRNKHYIACPAQSYGHAVLPQRSMKYKYSARSCPKDMIRGAHAASAKGTRKEAASHDVAPHLRITRAHPCLKRLQDNFYHLHRGQQTSTHALFSLKLPCSMLGRMCQAQSGSLCLHVSNARQPRDAPRGGTVKHWNQCRKVPSLKPGALRPSFDVVHYRNNVVMMEALSPSSNASLLSSTSQYG